MSNKKFIMVHGLASKRPEKDVHELCSLCIRESLVDYTIITGHMGKEEQNETHRTGKSQLKSPKSRAMLSVLPECRALLFDGASIETGTGR